jgi:hypothetical protein
MPADDAADLARQATITASSAAPDCPAANVANGVSRHRHEQTNQWASAEGQPLPQWLELRWPNLAQIACVELTFDTGFTRPLTHTNDEYFHGKQIRGPQPETVRDFRLQAWMDGDWRDLTHIAGNHFRKRVVNLHEPVSTQALRLIVEATNGEPVARLYELRVYASPAQYLPAVDAVPPKT